MMALAKLLTPIFYPEGDRDVTAEQAAMTCVQLKVMREVQANYPTGYRDNLDDICGFTNVLYRVKEARSDGFFDRGDTVPTVDPPEGEGQLGGTQLPGRRDARKPTRRGG